MDIASKKKEILNEIELIEDEKLLWAIARLLHLDDEGEAPDWHMQVIKERMEKYERGEGKLLKWDDVKNDL